MAGCTAHEVHAPTLCTQNLLFQIASTYLRHSPPTSLKSHFHNTKSVSNTRDLNYVPPFSKNSTHRTSTKYSKKKSWNLGDWRFFGLGSTLGSFTRYWVKLPFFGHFKISFRIFFGYFLYLADVRHKKITNWSKATFSRGLFYKVSVTWHAY
jgi:hypothetical protein